MILNIDVSAVIVYTNKLEKLGRSALPVAVRTALNSAAFDVKQRTMPKSAHRFIHRTENFFKANSSVDMAKGWDINSMASTVGFTSDKLRIGNTNFAVKDLEQQEYSGNIESKTFIPLNSARVSGDFNRVVSVKNRLSEIKKQPMIKPNMGGKGAFVKAVFKAGPGGLVLGNGPKEILWRIDSINKDDNSVNIKKTGLYSVRSGRSVRVKETGFMRFASLQSANRLEEFYIKEAEKQIEKLTR